MQSSFLQLCCIPYQSHLPWLYHRNYNRQSVQVMKLLITQLYPTFYYFIPL
jgi:hypothetical protein